MSVFLRLLGAFLLMGLAAPALAQTANVKVLKPLQLAVVRNMAFGDIVMGTLTGNETVRVLPTGRTCGTSGALTCSGTFSTALFRVSGSNGQQVQIRSAQTTYALTSAGGATLTLTPTYPTSVTLPNSGNPGVQFEVGGSFVIGPTTPSGIYSGTIDITVSYP